MSETTPALSNDAPRQRTLRHIVLFGFKPGTVPETIAEIETRFTALKGKIASIEALEWGMNNSPEGLDQGHTHCFMLTFATEAARDAYLPHPQHKAFVDWVGPFIENVTVIDYWAQ